MFGPPQNPGKPGDMISLCVGGRLFVTRRATLYRLPDSRLYLIATQGTSCQSTNSNNSFATPEAYTPSPMSNILSSSSTGLSPNPTERTVIGGASILPNNMAGMFGGNMNLKSASSLIRNRASIAPSAQCASPIAQTRCDLNTPANLSLPIGPHGPPLTPPGLMSNTAPSPVVYFYDRDPEIFRFVLDYYRTGELHLPSSICGPFVRKELIFWGIDESLIGPCCMPAYMRYDEEKRTKNTLFRDCFEDIDSMQNLVKFSRGWKKWRYRMWLFMDHPSSSLPAKIWASCLLVLMIASVMCYCLSTHDVFRMTSTVLATRGSLHRKRNATQQIPVMPNKTDIPTWDNPDIILSNFNGTNAPSADDNSLELRDICDPSLTLSNPKLRRDCYSEPSRGLVMADMTLNCLFTAEFMLKVLLAPDKQKFLSSIVSILDIIILSSYWVYIALFYYYYYHPKTYVLTNTEFRDQLSGYLWLMNILSMTQAMRILRIFKISKISRILRVLILTVKKSIPELVLLGFLLMNGMFLFSSLMYMAEYRVDDTFPDIPQSFWWSIITLTAVGYGDMHPKGGAGYFVGSVTAICGCIVTGLAIPIIGNNFNTYYKYMKNQLMEDKYLKTLRKDMEGTGMKSGIGAVADKSGLSLPGRKPRQINRHNQRDRAGKSLRRKLDGMLYLNTLSLKNYFKSRSARRTKPMANNVRDLDPPHGFSESQKTPLIKFSTRKIVEETKFTEDKSNIDKNLVNVANRSKSNSIEREPRPSLMHPQAIEKLPNSLSRPTRQSLLTPEIWVESEDEQEVAVDLVSPFISNGHQVDNQSHVPNLPSTLPCSNGAVSPCFESRSGMTSTRSSYQEIDFIPPINSENDAQLHKRFSLFTKHFSNRTSSEGEQNSFDSFIGKRKNYV